MLALIRSYSKDKDQGDCVVNGDNITRIALVKVKDHFTIFIHLNTTDSDSDMYTVTAVYDSEHDARASLSRLLNDLGMPTERAVEVAKDFRIKIAKVNSLELNLKEMLMKALQDKKE